MNLTFKSHDVHDELLFFTWFQWCNQGTNDQRLFDSLAENVLSSDFVLTSTKDSSSWKLKKQKFAHTLAHVATVIRRVTYKNVIVEEFIAATTWPPIHNKADVNVITYVKRNYLLQKINLILREPVYLHPTRWKALSNWYANCDSLVNVTTEWARRSLTTHTVL